MVSACRRMWCKGQELRGKTPDGHERQPLYQHLIGPAPNAQSPCGRGLQSSRWYAALNENTRARPPTV